MRARWSPRPEGRLAHARQEQAPTGWILGTEALTFLLVGGLEAYLPLVLLAGVGVGALFRGPLWCWVVTGALLVSGVTGIAGVGAPLLVFGPATAAVLVATGVTVYRLRSNRA